MFLIYFTVYTDLYLCFFDICIAFFFSLMLYFSINKICIYPKQVQFVQSTYIYFLKNITYLKQQNNIVLTSVLQLLHSWLHHQEITNCLIENSNVVLKRLKGFLMELQTTIMIYLCYSVSNSPNISTSACHNSVSSMGLFLLRIQIFALFSFLHKQGFCKRFYFFLMNLAFVLENVENASKISQC